MKIKTFFAIFLFISHVVAAQVPGRKSDSPFTAIDGSVYKVGDTLTMGRGANTNGAFNFIYVPANALLRTEKIEYSSAAGGLRFVIKHFSVVRNSGTTYAVFTYVPERALDIGILNACVNINPALESGELASKNPDYVSNAGKQQQAYGSLISSGQGSVNRGNSAAVNGKAQGSQLLNEEYSFIYYVKDKPNMRDYAIEYLFVHHSAVYREYANDEFNFQRVLDETVASMKKTASVFKDNQMFYINTKSTFGDYDFNKHAFLFTPLNPATYVTLHNIGGLWNQKGMSNTEVRLKFLNTHLFQGLYMDRDKAGNLVNQRKDYNSVNREVALIVYFTLVDYLEERPNSERNTVYLQANIDYIEVYDSYHYQRGTNQLLYTMRPAVQN